MLDVTVRFAEKDATVRFLPAKVTVEQILNRYRDTPFGVSQSEPVVAVVRTRHATVRGWAKANPPGLGKADKEKQEQIDLFVEMVPEKSIELTGSAQVTLSDSSLAGMKLLGPFQVLKANPGKLSARLERVGSSQAGLSAIAVRYLFTVVDQDKQNSKVESSLDIPVPSPAEKPASGTTSPSTEVVLLGGTLEVKLGHLCEDRGCVEHFHRSLHGITSLAAVRPHPDLKQPRANLYLRAHQAVDVWGLREALRDQGVEITGMVAHDLPRHQLRVQLPQWRNDQVSTEVQQCLVSRDRVMKLVQALAAPGSAELAGGGINFLPARPNLDLVTLLDAVAATGTAPQAVWLVPAGVPMPKTPPARTTLAPAKPKEGGSAIHPVIEFDFGPGGSVAGDALALLNQQKWPSQTRVDVGAITTARAAVADRAYASLTPFLNELRANGHLPRQIRLKGFGDVRIQMEFAHICGEYTYSKPPRPKKTDKEKPGEEKKPFVPKPIEPAKSSNGRKAIEAAISNVGWIKDVVFHDYHTRFEFRGGPQKIMISFQAKGEDVVRLDELIGSLQKAGFPPKSILVSRLFPGIPFAKPLPGEVVLTDTGGKKYTLESFKRPNRPLAVAFISLQCKRKEYKNYKPDPKLYDQLRQSIEKYKDRVDVVAVSANPDDRFEDVARFWGKTGLSVPLLHDEKGIARAVFNAQETPPPHLFIFDGDGLLRYAGDPSNQWEKPDDKREDYFAKALELIFAGKFQANGAVYYNKSLCNCSDPKCKCPKCGCGSTCRCAIKHCGVGF